ncbi:site-specific integrase [Peribacillus sp. TH14]|uniref:site-specific integrase n=1 Tax=Peribacillus sp. TH14 TaxID=2798481 RepID=UPI0019121CCD|nr:site-specific integrase [Peribacillus sp. TH14]MBK5502244.1 site-specific integrase [Peribacillus sp. TH14]
MAYFRKRGDKWSYTVNLGIDTITKKRKQITKSGFSSKTAAKDAAKEMEFKISRGEFVQDSNMNFHTLAEKWLESYLTQAKVSSVRARTKESNVLLKQWKNTPIKSINNSVYREYLNELSKVYSLNYTIGIHTTGRMMFKFAVESEWLQQNPTENYSLPKQQATIEEVEKENLRKKFLEKNELIGFLSLARTEGLSNDYTLFSLLAYSGIRIGESLALKWSDIDFRRGSISISKTLYNPTNNKVNYTLLTPKTKGSIRTIKMDDQVMKLLKKHLIQQNKMKIQNTHTYMDENFVFTSPEGYPLVQKLPAIRLQRLLKKLPHIHKEVTLHSFRHTHTSLLIEAGVGLKEIQQRLGHTDIQTTMNIYAHMTDNMEEKASHQFSKLMEDLQL